MKAYATTTEAAAYLHLDEKTLHRRVADGTLPASRQRGAANAYDWADLYAHRAQYGRVYHLHAPINADTRWVDDAACSRVDPELFFPGPCDWPTIREAKTVCGNCPVAAECLTYALDDPHIVGVWGGTTEADRRRLRKDTAA